ncbi:MAG: peptidoglycan-associated lipoprotein Pal [Magnetospirillum sp.]|nr:peptidoglycan-associated lipoprotein Pal [Magnetospirillum sp.]
MRHLSAAAAGLIAALSLAACSSEPTSTAAVTGSGQTGPGAAGQGGGIGRAGMPAPGSVAEFQSQVGDRVLFATASTQLSAAGREILARQAQWLTRYPQYRIAIEGHADERGTREYNLALGDRRAQTVKEFLLASGVGGSRMKTISYGKERPTAEGSSEGAWSQNRRAVTVPSM